jgi:Kef-type K+ transport system membrane component KefB/nucleotide-binding universal stress UspA family protein
MTQPFGAASHHDVLVLIIQLGVLLLTARLLGELFQRWGQPTVVGEILAGVVLGPSMLSAAVPGLEEWIVPQTATQGYLLETVGLIGVILLMLLTGLETDLALIRRQARSAFGVALGGLLLPLSLGFLLGELVPDELLANPNERFVFSLFVATAMSISAIPVLAKVLMDLNLMRRDIGQTLIASAMIDDTVGWILLSIVVGLASGGGITLLAIGESVGKVLGFLLVSFTVGGVVVRYLLGITQSRLKSRESTLTLMLVLVFLWGAVAQALNLEAMLGAFMIGIMFSQMPHLGGDSIHKIESVVIGIFAPVFFAIAGLKVNLPQLIEPTLLLVLLLVIAIATIAKVLGVYIGARLLAKRDHWTALFYGAGLNARGSMEIIVATIGLRLGILSQDMFSIIVVMAVVTSIMAPAMLRWALNHIQPDPQELERLQREALNKDNRMANVRRILVPMRLRPPSAEPASQTIQTRLLNILEAQLNPITTLLCVTQPDCESDAQDFLGRMGGQLSSKYVGKKLVLSDAVEKSILEESKRGYDLMLLGASEGQVGSNHLFTELVDNLIRLAPCPTLVFHSLQLRLPSDWSPQRILVPVTGSEASRHALQLAYLLAANSEREVILLHVVQRRPSQIQSPILSQSEQRELQIGREMLADLAQIGALYNAHTQTQVEVNAEPERGILSLARHHQVDLMILGTNVRPASGQLYLGARVERLLNNAPCPVVIFNAG